MNVAPHSQPKDVLTLLKEIHLHVTERFL
jgi:hypothetical protein